MAKRALLIGSPYAGLTGVENDIATMTGLLDRRGFVIDRCMGMAATRKGILHAWRRLISLSADGDAVAIYYSGHGGLAASTESEATEVAETGVRRPSRFQFIVPMDFDGTTDDAFRGIANVELSRLLRDLTLKTRNVTVVLDCCHAARMSRDLDLTPRALPRAWYLGVARHVERLRSQGLLDGPTFAEGNPDAVRVVAAATTESAYEYTNAQGRRTGVLTEALGIALEAVGQSPISWRSVLYRLRERVASIAPQQHPDVEGPDTRVLFGLDTVDVTGTLGIGVVDSRMVLRGGRVGGVEEGDVYAVMAFGAERIDPSTQIAEAVVVRVRGATADVELEYLGGHRDVPDGALAFPLRKGLHRWPIGLTGDASVTAMVRSRIASSRFVREAGPDEEDPPLATVRLDGSELALLDRTGVPLVRPRHADDAAIEDTAVNLDTLARAQHLLMLEGGTGRYALDVPVTIEWGRVERGRRVPVGLRGETLLVGEKIYVTLHNGGEITVFVSVFDIGVTGQVTLLSESSPSGLELPAGKSYLLGEDEYDGTLDGMVLSWPETAPPDKPRRETIAVVSTRVPHDLRSLETSAMRAVRAIPERPHERSELQTILDQVSFGGLRDMTPPPRSVDMRYGVHRIDFTLDPSPSAVPGLPEMGRWAATDRGYVFDERPDRSLARIAARSPEQLPGAIAVRLTELVVHRNRALFGDADLRLDCMVVTSGTKIGVPYRVATARFPGIRDGDRLPMDNLLVFHGPVREFIDIAVWISRDEPRSLTLTELLQKELNSTEFKTAAGALASLVALGPHGAAAIVGIGAAGTLTSISARLIAAAIGKSIGLYRTSLLASEQFGLGRHPSIDLLRSQDFSFAYEILSVI